MGTDWFVKVKCPRPNKKVKTREEHIAVCGDCPYVIWEKPQSVAGFMATMCGARVGSIGMAEALDSVAESLLGVERFTKFESSASIKLDILKQVKIHAQSTGWRIDGLGLEETLKHLDFLIEFCRRAKTKGLWVTAWA
jgi:hypothetical protein